MRETKTTIVRQPLWIPRGNEIGDYPPDYPEIICTTKTICVGGVKLELESHNPPFLFDKRLPRPPTKAQLTTALLCLAEKRKLNLANLRGLTYRVSQPGPKEVLFLRYCKKCKNALARARIRETHASQLDHIEYCQMPHCRQAYISLFKIGAFDCLNRRWVKF